VADRQLTTEQADAAGLPRGGCCCPEHPHDWYQRDSDGEWWLECNACGEARKLSPPVTDADCRLVGAGDGSVMVYCGPCRLCLCPRAVTLNAAVGFWEEHTEREHPAPPQQWGPPAGTPDPWAAQGPVPPPPF
jgi:hypothetical protein